MCEFVFVCYVCEKKWLKNVLKANNTSCYHNNGISDESAERTSCVTDKSILINEKRSCVCLLKSTQYLYLTPTNFTFIIHV